VQELSEAKANLAHLIEQVYLSEAIVNECEDNADQAESAWREAVSELFKNTQHSNAAPVLLNSLDAVQDLSKLIKEQATQLAHALLQVAGNAPVSHPRAPSPTPMQAESEDRGAKRPASQSGINTPERWEPQDPFAEEEAAEGSFPDYTADSTIEKLQILKAKYDDGFTGFDSKHLIRPADTSATFASVAATAASIPAAAAASSNENPANPAIPDTPESYARLKAAKGDHNPQASGQPY